MPSGSTVESAVPAGGAVCQAEGADDAFNRKRCFKRLRAEGGGRSGRRAAAALTCYQAWSRSKPRLPADTISPLRARAHEASPRQARRH